MSDDLKPGLTLTDLLWLCCTTLFLIFALAKGATLSLGAGGTLWEVIASALLGGLCFSQFLIHKELQATVRSLSFEREKMQSFLQAIVQMHRQGISINNSLQEFIDGYSSSDEQAKEQSNESRE